MRDCKKNFWERPASDNTVSSCYFISFTKKKVYTFVECEVMLWILFLYFSHLHKQDCFVAFVFINLEQVATRGTQKELRTYQEMQGSTSELYVLRHQTARMRSNKRQYICSAHTTESGSNSFVVNEWNLWCFLSYNAAMSVCWEQDAKDMLVAVTPVSHTNEHRCTLCVCRGRIGTWMDE